MKEGEVILAEVPQADGVVKSRPAIVLREMPGYGDLLVSGISTQLHKSVRDFDETIGPSDGDFAASGLQSSSVIRLGFLAVVPRNHVIGTTGEISALRHRRLLRTLSDYLTRDS